MNTLRSGVLAVALGLLSTPVIADHANHSLARAERLVSDCKSSVTALRGVCQGYLAAMADGIARHQKLGVAGRTVCAPEDANLEAYRQAVLKYAEDRPPAAGDHSFELVKAALEAKWPCARQGTPPRQ